MRINSFITVLILVLSVFFTIGGLAESYDTAESKVLANLLQTPLHFIANNGQMDNEISFYTRGFNTTVYCTDRGISLSFPEGNVNLRLLDGNRVHPEGRVKLVGIVNWIKGRNPELWRTDIPTFGEVVYPSVYPGIDLVYSGDQRRLKYTFYVHPGVDPEQIRMMYEGIEDIQLDKINGELVIQASWGKIRDLAPIAYQEIEGVRHNVDMEFYVMDDKSVKFIIGDYNPEHKLVLDPTYSTYLGGKEEDYCNSIDLDSSGNVYVTGYTNSAVGFPLKNAYQTTLDGGTFTDNDAFVTKISSSGGLIYSTYFGGTETDRAAGIAADDSGNAYITGWTYSDTDFPIKNAFQDTSNGGDAFVARFSSTGQLDYSSYLGGNKLTSGSAIEVDNLMNVYITGNTSSNADFPIKDAVQSQYGGGNNDAFVTKLSSNFEIIYSTYLGGNSTDLGNDIGVDSSGNAYIVGDTFSNTGFPLKDAYQNTIGGHYDMFLTKLSSTGVLEYSTYFGGDKWDSGNGIAVSASGAVCITGRTESLPNKFPIKNAFQGNIGGDKDAYVAKFSNVFGLEYCTYLGGGDYDDGRGIAMDSAGKAYITGVTRSYSGFPLEVAFQDTFGGNVTDAYVAKLSSTGQLEYSTYLGGIYDDTGMGIEADDSEIFYVTGYTQSNNFYTKNAFQNSNKGVTDGFVTKLNTLPAKEVTCKIDLNSGWNMLNFSIGKCFYEGDDPVGLPYGVEPININTLKFAHLSDWFDSIITPSNAWEMVIGSDGAMNRNLPPALHSLKSISCAYGYWLKVKENATISISGFLFDSSNAIPLKSGWNLVGCPLDTAYYNNTELKPEGTHVPKDTNWIPVTPPVVDHVFMSIKDKYDMVIGESGVYNPSFPLDSNSLHFIGPGYAYWIRMKEKTELKY